MVFVSMRVGVRWVGAAGVTLAKKKYKKTNNALVQILDAGNTMANLHVDVRTESSCEERVVPSGWCVCVTGDGSNQQQQNT